MNYRGDHRKYEPNTSVYRVYNYGDVVKRNGVFYICGITTTYGYIPEDANSGFIIYGSGATAAPANAFTFGATAPASASAGDQWMDSSNGTFYIYVQDQDSGQWVQPNPGSLTLDGGNI